MTNQRSARTRLIAAGGAVTLAATVGLAAVWASGRDADGGTPGGADRLDDAAPVAVRGFPGCPELLDYFRSQARGKVTAYGLPGVDGPLVAMTMAAGAREFSRGAVLDGLTGSGGADSGGADSAVAPAAGQVPGAVDTSAGSGTNVQVAGVDEGDLVKRSGDLLLTVADGRFRVAKLADGKVRMIGSLKPADWVPTQLLVDGDTVLMIGQLGGWNLARPGFGEPGIAMPEPAVPDIAQPGVGVGGSVLPISQPVRTRIAQVDLRDPSSPSLVRTLDVAGTPSGVRLHDGVARLAITSQPRLKIGPPTLPGPGEVGPDGVAPGADSDDVDRAVAKALASNRAAVAKAPLKDWLPDYQLTEYRGDGAKGETSSGQLLDCPAVSAPLKFSGFSTTSMLTIDLRRPEGISSWAGSAVVASGGTLYATADHAYLATSPWVDWAALTAKGSDDVIRQAREQRTQIHLFDTADSTAPKYVGSGQVPGFLLGQFAMDEYQGKLRVASTEQPEQLLPMLGIDPSGSVESAPEDLSQSMVTVLEPDDNRLRTVGSVDGLGQGEVIRAVRFIGPQGYVVTFRQTDPLYTVDLSEPTRPRVAGELKILGYSAYLHPVGDGLLLGLGQDADDEGRTTGMQLSLFDVRDPARPTRVDQIGVPGAWSDVEGDHHAFTFTDSLALAPFAGPVMSSVQGKPEGSEYDAGVLAVRLDDRKLGKPNTLRPVADGPIDLDESANSSDPLAVPVTPLRTLVVDGFIYTVTPTGIAAHDVDSMKRVGFTTF